MMGSLSPAAGGRLIECVADGRTRPRARPCAAAQRWVQAPSGAVLATGFGAPGGALLRLHPVSLLFHVLGFEGDVARRRADHLERQLGCTVRIEQAVRFLE